MAEPVTLLVCCQSGSGWRSLSGAGRPPAGYNGSVESWLAGEVARKRALFAYAHADMRGRQPEIPAELAMLRARAELTALPSPSAGRYSPGRTASTARARASVMIGG
ncbi:hypothetical protein [Micromonospora sp. L32]|uniref:hypothetical protein n=1 Tax=Micromonospora sp. L32 TaxID=3452214 RepID=UPI003F8AE706